MSSVGAAESMPTRCLDPDGYLMTMLMDDATHLILIRMVPAFKDERCQRCECWGRAPERYSSNLEACQALRGRQHCHCTANEQAVAILSWQTVAGWHVPSPSCAHGEASRGVWAYNHNRRRHTMRSGSITKVLARHMLKYDRMP